MPLVVFCFVLTSLRQNFNIAPYHCKCLYPAGIDIIRDCHLVQCQGLKTLSVGRRNPIIVLFSQYCSEAVILFYCFIDRDYAIYFHFFHPAAPSFISRLANVILHGIMRETSMDTVFCAETRVVKQGYNRDDYR